MLSSGLPTSPDYQGIEPTGSPGTQLFPITADFVRKSQNLNRKTIFVIALSALVLLIVCCAAISVFLKYRKICNSSNAVGPMFTSSTNKRCGKSIPFVKFH